MDDQDDREYSRAPELEDLLTLCQALNAERVRYVLIGGFAVILHGFVRATKDIDLLVDASAENIQRLKRAMAVLPDNAVALIADDEVEKYQVVRIADEIVVDLLKDACGVDYSRASKGGIETKTVSGVPIPVARKELLIETKQTVRRFVLRLGGHARAVVGDLDRAAGGDVHLDLARVAAVRDRIAQQIGDGASDRMCVGIDGHALDVGAKGELVAARDRERSDIGGDVARELHDAVTPSAGLHQPLGVEHLPDHLPEAEDGARGAAETMETAARGGDGRRRRSGGDFRFR